jgi:hypothetical protein
LISNDALEGSPSEPYEVQAQMITELSARAFANYKLPTLKAATAFAFLHKAATGASFLQGSARITYTGVQETTEGRQLSVGVSPLGGLAVLRHDFAFGRDRLGVMALWEF